MPRQARQISGTGIFHVMMRGINHQNIFEDEEVYFNISQEFLVKWIFFLIFAPKLRSSKITN
jgi:hypothetical protein